MPGEEALIGHVVGGVGGALMEANQSKLRYIRERGEGGVVVDLGYAFTGKIHRQLCIYPGF